MTDSSDAGGTIPYAAVPPYLSPLNLDSSQYITLSDADPHSTRMIHYFHYQHKHFIDYLNDPVLDGAVIYAGDVPFWNDEQEGTYTEIFGNSTNYMFVAASRDHKFLLNHRSIILHFSPTPIESRKTNHDCINNSQSI